jgi:hypothetical protein
MAAQGVRAAPYAAAGLTAEPDQGTAVVATTEAQLVAAKPPPYAQWIRPLDDYGRRTSRMLDSGRYG